MGNKLCNETWKKKYDIQDRLIFNLFLDSAVRISAGHSLKLSQLNLENNCFDRIRHKEGYVKPVFFFDNTKKLILEWLKRERKTKNRIRMVIYK